MKFVYPRYILIVTGSMIGSGLILSAIGETWITISLPLIVLTG